MGKTTLTVQAAHHVRDRYPDGQVFLDLGGTTPMPMEPENALGQLLRALGVPPEEMPGGLQARSGLFRSLLADRRMLSCWTTPATPRRYGPCCRARRAARSW